MKNYFIYSLICMQFFNWIPLEKIVYGVCQHILHVAEKPTNANFIVFSLTWPGLEPTIYHTQGEHNNQYTTKFIL
jgi:hypothetical protein